jgi:hypothetical protein
MWNINDSGKFDKNNFKTYVMSGFSATPPCFPFYSSKDDIAFVSQTLYGSKAAQGTKSKSRF